MTGNVTIVAQTYGQAESDAEGTTAGGIAVGISQANSTWAPTATANVESDSSDPTNLSAGGNIAVQAYNNYYDGSPVSVLLYQNSAGQVVQVGAPYDQATANSSEGSLAGGVGSDAEADGTAAISAVIGDNAVVSSGGDVNITAESANNLLSTANGDAYGVAVGGSVDADAYLSNQAEAYTGSSVQLTAGNNIVIFGGSNNYMAVNSTGGQGGLIAVGGAESTAELTTNDTEATIGDNNTVSAGDILSVTADNSLNVTSTTNQSASGGNGNVRWLVLSLRIHRGVFG